MLERNIQEEDFFTKPAGNGNVDPLYLCVGSQAPI